MTSEERARDQWRGMVAQMRDCVYGYQLDELHVLQWLVEERRRELRGDPQPIRPIDTKGLTGHLLQTALDINDVGMTLYRRGNPAASAFGGVASRADQAKADPKFQKLLGFVTAPGPQLTQPPKDTP